MSTNPEDTTPKPSAKRSRKKKTEVQEAPNEEFLYTSEADAKTARDLQAERQLNLQMELFQTVDPSRPEQEQRYSNTVDLYDALPKYEWEPSSSEVPDQLVRYREINGQRYQVTVTPATIKRDGKSVRVFPGIREEIVEDALRKFVAAGQYTVHGGEVGVRFTVKQVFDELASLNRTYSRVEIREAIEVCARAGLEVQSDDGKRLILANFFPVVMFTDRDEWLKSNGEARCFVRFNPLVTTSIVNDTWRRYNYKVAMSIRSSLARFIYKRISHYWIQAAEDAPYSFRMINFLEQTPRGVKPQMTHNIRSMNQALDVLIKQNVLTRYEQDRIMDPKRSNRVLDVKYILYPHSDFIRDAKAANALRQQRTLIQLKNGLKKKGGNQGKKRGDGSFDE